MQAALKATRLCAQALELVCEFLQTGELPGTEAVLAALDFTKPLLPPASREWSHRLLDEMQNLRFETLVAPGMECSAHVPGKHASRAVTCRRLTQERLVQKRCASAAGQQPQRAGSLPQQIPSFMGCSRPRAWQASPLQSLPLSCRFAAAAWTAPNAIPFC